MKATAISAFLLLIITLSCQSEYERQLAKGKDIVEMQITNKDHLSASENHSASSVHSELQKCAQLSGNKRLFNVELQHYEASLERQVATKYP